MRRVTALAALMLLVACDDARPAAAPAPLTGEVLQFRRDSEARVVQVRLTAREETGVERVLLEVDGFTPPPSYTGTTTLPAGRPLDVRMTLTAPDCDAEPGDLRARLTPVSGDPLVVPVDDGGLLRRLHDRECADEALLDQVSFEVVSLTATATPALRVVVRLTRRSGSAPVRITDAGDNTVYVVDPVGDLPTLTRGSSDLVLDLVPSRCDVHALGESYRTSLVDLQVAVGDAPPRTFVYAAPDDVRRRIERFAVDTCRAQDGGPG